MCQSSNRLNDNVLFRLFILFIQGNLIRIFMLVTVIRNLFPWIPLFPLIDNANLFSSSSRPDRLHCCVTWCQRVSCRGICDTTSGCNHQMFCNVTKYIWSFFLLLTHASEVKSNSGLCCKHSGRNRHPGFLTSA